MKTILNILFILLFFNSCESKSGKIIPEVANEKVIPLIIEYDYSTGLYIYKVNRFTKGVVGYITDKNIYSIGDTILITKKQLISTY